VFADWFLAVRAEIALGLGRLQESLASAEQAATNSERTGGIAGEAFGRQVWGRTLARLAPPQWKEAEAQFAEAQRLFEAVPCPPEVAHTHVLWGTVCGDRGDLTAAREHWEQAAALWEACGITWELEKVRALIAALPEA
jgi:tetratricopeptide (TPR) repeat protein